MRETLGTAAVIENVADARERARRSMQKAQSGTNPVSERRSRQEAAKLRAEKLPDTFEAVADR